MDKITIVLIEDHDLSRIGLCAALKQYSDLEVVDSAANGKEGINKIKQHQPDIALVDIGLPDIDGIEVTQKIKSMSKKLITKVMILSMHDSEESVIAAFAAGADSYSLKNVDMNDLVNAIHQTYQGNSWIDPAIAQIVLKQAKNKQQAEQNSSWQSVDTVNTATQSINTLDPTYQQVLESYPLTERELEVLELIVSGCSNADIAEKLFITVGTVKTHVCHILNKLCADDRTQAAVRALRAGLVK